MIGDRMFTLEEARERLPRIRRISRRYFYQVERLKEVFKATNDLDELRVIEQEVNALINRWIEELNRLEVEAQGLWLVAFDNGDGIYFLWEFDDPDISGYCTYFNPNDRIPLYVWTHPTNQDQDYLDRNHT